MFRGERGFIPLNQLEGKRLEVGNRVPSTIIFDTQHFPDYHHFDGTTLKEGIGINISAIHRRNVLYGIDRLRILAQAGETSTVTPSVVSVNNESTGTMGLTSVCKKVSTFETKNEGNEQTIILNLGEMSKRINDKGEPLRSPQAWSKAWNRAIELAFLQHQWDKMIATKGQWKGILSVGVGSAANIAFMSEKLSVGSKGLLFAGGYFLTTILFGSSDNLLRESQTFSFERTIIGGLVALKDPVLHTHSLVKAIAPTKR